MSLINVYLPFVVSLFYNAVINWKNRTLILFNYFLCCMLPAYYLILIKPKSRYPLKRQIIWEIIWESLIKHDLKRNNGAMNLFFRPSVPGTCESFRGRHSLLHW